MIFEGGDFYIYRGVYNENVLWIRDVTDCWVRMFQERPESPLAYATDADVAFGLENGAGCLVRHGQVLTLPV